MGQPERIEHHQDHQTQNRSSSSLGDPFKPPQNNEAEMSVLGAVMLDNDSLNKILEILKPEDFYRQAHAKIYAAMIALSQRGEPIDVATLFSMIRHLGSAKDQDYSNYLNVLSNHTSFSGNITNHAALIKEASSCRQILKASNAVQQKVLSDQQPTKDVLEFAQQTFFQIARDENKGGFTSVNEHLNPIFKNLERLYHNKSAITGVPTGFIDLDNMTAGMQPSDLIIVAGRPSMGKTAFALNLAEHAAIHAETPVPVAVFSLEMAKEQLIQRLLCSVSKVDASRLRTGQLHDSDWGKLSEGAAILSKANIFIDDTPSISINELRAKARRLKAEHGTGMIMVDYLQLMTGSNTESRQQEISDISRGLKALAKELSVPVIALSQLNRSLEQRADKRPIMADLRESGAIEQDADVIMFVYRDAVYCEDCKNKEKTCDKGHEMDAEIIIGKQRNGPIGTTNLAFEGRFTRFLNRSHRPEA